MHTEEEAVGPALLCNSLFSLYIHIHMVASSEDSLCRPGGRELLRRVLTRAQVVAAPASSRIPVGSCLCSRIWAVGTLRFMFGFKGNGNPLYGQASGVPSPPRGILDHRPWRGGGGGGGRGARDHTLASGLLSRVRTSLRHAPSASARSPQPQPDNPCAPYPEATLTLTTPPPPTPSWSPSDRMPVDQEYNLSKST